ncbi:hypothetical protein C8J57DRAFT_1383618, partial [Mycena rebaudengoi]
IIFSTMIIYIFRPNCFVLLQGFFIFLRRVCFVVLVAIYWATNKLLVVSKLVGLGTRTGIFRFSLYFQPASHMYFMQGLK